MAAPHFPCIRRNEINVANLILSGTIFHTTSWVSRASPLTLCGPKVSVLRGRERVLGEYSSQSISVKDLK
jgi:hypothetical protein